MTEFETHMAREIAEAPEVVARMLATNAKALTELGRLYRERKPSHVVTCARGSSDCAASYFKYLIEITLSQNQDRTWNGDWAVFQRMPFCAVGAGMLGAPARRLSGIDSRSCHWLLAGSYCQTVLVGVQASASAPPST